MQSDCFLVKFEAYVNVKKQIKIRTLRNLGYVFVCNIHERLQKVVAPHIDVSGSK